MRVLWVFSEWSLSVLWVISESFRSVLWVFSEWSLSVPWVISESFLSVLWVFSESFLSVPWVAELTKNQSQSAQVQFSGCLYLSEYVTLKKPKKCLQDVLVWFPINSTSCLFLFHFWRVEQVPCRSLVVSIHFLAVQNSSIGDLVTQWLTEWLTEWYFDFGT